MICKFCGNVIEDNSDFCFICGQKVVAETPAYAAQVYSQKPEGAPAEPVPVAPVAPVEPVYAPPVVPEEAPKKKKFKKIKIAKKAKKDKAPAVVSSTLSKQEKILTAVLPALLLAVAGVMCSKIIVVAICLVLTGVAAYFLYKKYNEAIGAGYEEKATELLNTGMLGLCIGMAIVIIFLVKTYMLG